MELNFKKSGSGEPLIVLHGLFGMLDNWQTVTKELEKEFTVYFVDQRNHGKSPHTNEHSYKLMSADLLEFFQQQNITSANLIGHSMGGKTAMQFALENQVFVNKLIVVDMGIKRYSSGHDNIFDALFSVDLSKIHYRSDAEKFLLDKIPNFSTRQFILKNIARDITGKYTWKFNLEALYNNYETEILAPITSTHVFNKKTLFIRGEKSDYIQNEDWDAIQELFPNSVLQTVKGSGHWVHAEKPAELMSIVLKVLTD